MDESASLTPGWAGRRFRYGLAQRRSSRTQSGQEPRYRWRNPQPVHIVKLDNNCTPCGLAKPLISRGFLAHTVDLRRRFR